jgi:hypothetical protein
MGSELEFAGEEPGRRKRTAVSFRLPMWVKQERRWQLVSAHVKSGEEVIDCPGAVQQIVIRLAYELN